MFDKGYTKRTCPVVIRGTVNGKFVSLSTARYLPPDRARSLEAARDLALLWERSGKPVRPEAYAPSPEPAAAQEPPPRTTIEMAVAAFMMEVRTALDVDSPEGGRLATRALLSAHPELTAIAFVSDFMAVGSMREIRRRGRRIPQDISIAGFDDIAPAQYWYPAVTSVHIPREQIGQRICDALLWDEKKMPTQETVIEPELVLRNSTGPAARS